MAVLIRSRIDACPIFAKVSTIDPTSFQLVVSWFPGVEAASPTNMKAVIKVATTNDF